MSSNRPSVKFTH